LPDNELDLLRADSAPFMPAKGTAPDFVELKDQSDKENEVSDKKSVEEKSESE